MRPRISWANVTETGSQANARTRTRARFEVPEELRADVRLLGELLGRVLVEYAGQPLLDDVERLRELTIAGDGEGAERLVATWPHERAEDVARAFTCYFHLTNLSEELHRARVLRERDRAGDAPSVSELAQAVEKISLESGEQQARALLNGLEFRPVLTAHPTEARRRAVLATIRRISTLLEERSDPRTGDSELAENRRRLVEQIDILWRTSQLRTSRPTPLDEVRSAMAVFEETLFDVVGNVYRRLDDALAGETAGTKQPVVAPFVRLGSWIGGDRDGNPNVTAAVTREAMQIQADHVLRALEGATDQLGRALTLDSATTPPSAPVRRILEDARAVNPDLIADIETRSPSEPHRQLLLLAARRLAATRARDADFGYPRATDFLHELKVLQDSLVSAGAPRQAYGELQQLIWQVSSFGFHLAELEVRQHSSVHTKALEDVLGGGELSDQTEEVLATLRVIGQIQQRFGPEACRRYVVSFTRNAGDLAAVYELADAAMDGRPIELDVVPLFETGEDLQNSVEVLDNAIQLTRVRHRLTANDRRFEVMLGYSDSAKDVGPVSATLALYDAQARITAWAQRNAIRLTLFHGRGGALGRGGGPANRAVLAQAPGSVAGRFKLTEQGEAIPARYGNAAIAQRHIEQVTAATLLASTPAIEERAAAAADRFAVVEKTMDEASRTTYHRLVKAPGFAEWFGRVTPLEELGQLPLGSRPARRGVAVSSLEDLRAIPWVFAWSQARVNAPGWYGLGSALAAVGDVAVLQDANKNWPLFQVMLENAEMSLAKTDRRILGRYLELGDRQDLTQQMLDEHELTTQWVLKVLGGDRLLSGRRVLGRAVELRNPYVDALSYLQLRALRTLRTDDSLDEEQIVRTRRLLLLTVSGVAAGLQNTG
ncbi:phosphoenolpyruvate carboxylase type 1 [Kribbella orskensis]|uniref:Phosphoenolpyruvate carboxylase n=1 Tax=Kribbella orskensis TaxID=2512216 RepID=A0ABY2BUU8_9ACTN|nr:phosphoenolpyruvate carboxylase type 1 [Kribbella sp. VKM Ac-2500]TCO32071.1 phosphoenolpyruvate carboxylase type 1 [Kribbella orskensis]